jgi:Protein of unknown function (DUF2867)
MENTIIQEVAVPSDNLAMGALSSIDFVDAFKCQIPNGRSHKIDAVARSIFSTMPEWMMKLLDLRNTIVRPLGLKTSIDPALLDRRQGKLEPGTVVGVFKVIDRQDDEILLGEDDRHLNFRTSIQLERKEEKCWVIVSTVVQFNNWLGHAYFVPVRPIHKIIVPAMMRYGMENLIGEASEDT